MGELAARRSITELVAAAVLFGLGALSSFAAPERFGNVEAIKAAQLKEWLYVVASDDMEGRDTPSRGLDLTAKFIADHLSQWGVKPG